MSKIRIFIFPALLLLGAGLSFATVFSAQLPFAAVVALCLPPVYGCPLAVGAVAAGAVFQGFGAIPLAASLGAAVLSRLRRPSPDVTDCALVAGVYAVSAIAVAVLSGEGFVGIVAVIFSGGISFLLALCGIRLAKRIDASDDIPAALACICLGGAVCAFSGCGIGGANVGAVLAAYSVLLASVRYGAGAGTLVAAISAIAAGLSNPADFSTVALLGIPAVICGVTSFGSPVRAAAVMLVTVSPSVIFFGASEQSLGLLIDCAVASAAFVVSYPAAAKICAKIMTDDPKRTSSLKSERLKAALGEISERLYSLSEKSPAVQVKFSDVLYERVCSGCESRESCGGSGLSATEKMTDTADIYRALPSCARVTEIKKVGQEIRRRGEYISLVSSENRSRARYCSDILLCVGDMISDIEKENRMGPKPDRLLSVRLERLLRREDIKTIGVSVYKSGAVMLDLPMSQKINEVKLCSLASEVSGCDYQKPERSEIGETALMRLTPKAVYFADIGTCQLSATKEPSGDVADSFTCGENFYAILSDGMGRGNGARAAALALVTVLKELICAGFAVKTSIELSSLILKASIPEESFATLDLMKLNLISGAGEFYKAGGCVSYLICDGKEMKIRSGGYPAGIIDPCEITSQRFYVRNSAEILMMTDGAAGISFEDFKNALESGCRMPTGEAAALLINEASEGKNDDISVTLVKIGLRP